MALPLANSASGGTAAAAVTTANSGGASGDPFEVVNTGTGTLVYDATHPAHGTGLGYKASSPRRCKPSTPPGRRRWGP
jgi:hypothetical protein